MKANNLKVALVENFGADFVTARLRYALFLKSKSINVVAIIPKDGHGSVIEERGITTIEVGTNIRAKGLATKFKYAKQLRSVLVDGNFDIVHFYRLQPNIIGTIVAGLSCRSKIVNHITGLGIAFSKNDLKSKIQRGIIKFIYRSNHKLFKPYYIFQNEQDAKDLGIFKRTICIKGSAVNENRFNLSYIKENFENEIKLLEKKFSNANHDSKIFLFVSRIIREKGILELIEGFKKANNIMNDMHKLLIVGWSDDENPSSVSKVELETYINGNPNIIYLGKRSDVELLLKISDVSILPTYYREGTPRFLLESMIMKKALITTDMPGCNHLIADNKNGLLIQPRSVLEVEEAILSILNYDLNKLGEESQNLYFEKFSEDIVYTEILNLYSKI